MLASFSDAFIKKPLFTGKPSDALIEALNRELPEGCQYTYSGEQDVCFITTQGSMVINGLKIQLPQEIKHVLAQSLSDSQLMEILYKYQYNLQKPLEVMASESAIVDFENGSVPLEKMVISPMHRVQKENGKFVIFPVQTKQRFRLTLSDEQHEIEIELEQKPSGVWNEDIYVSVPGSPLSINMRFNFIERHMAFNVAVDMKSSKNVYDYMSALYIYDAFQTGNVRMNNISFQMVSGSGNVVPNSIFNFWKGIAALQERISQPFVLPTQLEKEDVVLGEKLICSIIREKPFKTERRIDSISFKASSEECASIRSHLNSESLFVYSKSETSELFGVTFSLFCCTVIRGGILSDVTDISENEHIAHFSPSERSKPYCAERYFLTEDAMDAYMKNDQFINQMTHADTLNELFENE